ESCVRKMRVVPPPGTEPVPPATFPFALPSGTITMKCLRTALPAALALLLLAAVSPAQEPIRCGRTPDISPHGKTVAFSYLGGLWTVETIGGVARPVTMHEAYHVNPVYSPDGKWLAFTSTRNGSYDVFVCPAEGGKPRRLTFDSAS